jgi:hypothetical protein
VSWKLDDRKVIANIRAIPTSMPSASHSGMTFSIGTCATQVIASAVAEKHIGITTAALARALQFSANRGQRLKIDSVGHRDQQINILGFILSGCDRPEQGNALDALQGLRALDESTRFPQEYYSQRLHDAGHLSPTISLRRAVNGSSEHRRQ